MNKQQTFLKVGVMALLMTLFSVNGFAQWEPLKAPNGDYLKDFEYFNEKLYALSSTTLYRSFNYGATWEVVMENTGSAIDSKLFVTAGELFVVWDNLGVFKLSEDGLDVTTTPWFGPVEADYIYHNGHHFHLDFQHQILRDGQYIYLLPPSVYGFFRSYSDGTLWMGTKQGIYRTNDLGNTWEVLQPSWNITALEVYGDTIFVGTQDNYTYRRSYDGGQTWSSMGNMNGNPAYHFQLLDGKLYGLTTNLYVSNNMGGSWTLINPSYGNRDPFKEGSLLVTANSTGCLRSVNNGSYWTVSNTGLLSDNTESEYFRLSKQGNAVAAEPFYVSGGGGSGLTNFTTSQGKTWKRPLIVPDGSLSKGIFFHDGSYYAYDIFEDKFYTSALDVGGPWSVVNSVGLPAVGQGFLSTEVGILAWDNDKFYRSTNGGQNWTPSYALPGDVTSDHIGLYNGQLFANVQATVLRSGDYGATWLPLQNDGLPSGDNYSVEDFEWREGTLYVDTWAGLLLKSEDQGDHWTEIDNGLQDLLVNNPSIYDIIISEAGMLVDNTIDLLFSPDFGQTWENFNGNMPDTFYTVGGVATTDAYYISGFDGSLWRRDFSTARLAKASGKVYYDANVSGGYDPGEQGLPDALLFTQDENTYLASDEAGDYTLYAQAFSNDTIILHLPSPYLTASPSFHELQNGATGLDFGVNFIPGIKDLSVTLTEAGPVRPGFSTLFTLTLANNGTTVQSGQVTLQINDQLQITDTTSDSTSFVNGTVSWDFTDLYPFDRLNYLVEVYTPEEMALGVVLPFVAVAGPVQGDVLPADNSYTLNLEVVGSYDPNYKEVRPNGLTPSMVADSTELEYTVHFQNVGTYPASFVEIRDTLSSNLDLATLQILSASHDYRWELREGRVLDVHFDDINLADSVSNEPASHGFVKYKVRPLRSLVLGDQVDNTAYIYFDFNAPVVTNTTTTEVSLVLSADEETAPLLSLSVSPNPSARWLLLQAPSLPNGQGVQGDVSVFSATGVRVYHGAYAKDEKLDIGAFVPGVYFVVVRLEGKLYKGRFVKQ